jgi:CDP-diglyceride synthetase
MILLIILIFIFCWKWLQKIPFSKRTKAIFIGYLCVYCIWLYLQSVHKLSFRFDFLDVLSFLFFGFVLNLLLSQWLTKNRTVVQTGVCFIVLCTYFNLPHLHPILDNFNDGRKITNGSPYSVTTRGFITGFTDQGYVIILNEPLGCFEKGIKYTDGYLHDISDNIIWFKTNNNLDTIRLIFNNGFHLQEAYSILPLYDL